MKRFAFIVAVFCLFGATLWADGGDRLATPEEQAFIKSCYEKTIALLPSAPEGVEKKPQEVSISKFMGLGAENYPITSSFYCEYKKTADMSKMINMADDAKGLEDMSEQMSKISEEMEKAASSGDQKKIMEIQAKMQAVMAGNSTMQNIQSSIDEQNKQSMHIDVSINQSGCDYYLYKEIPVPANASYAIRREKNENGKDFSNTETVLFFGAFDKKLVNETYEIYAPRVKAESKKIHRIILTFKGEAKLADEYIARMNLAGFAALLK